MYAAPASLPHVLPPRNGKIPVFRLTVAISRNGEETVKIRQRLLAIPLRTDGGTSELVEQDQALR